MIIDPQAFGQLAASIDNSGAYSRSGLRFTDAPKDSRRKGAINNFTIQNLAVVKALELLGEDAWDYGCKSKAKAVLEDASYLGRSTKVLSVQPEVPNPSALVSEFPEVRRSTCRDTASEPQYSEQLEDGV